MRVSASPSTGHDLNVRSRNPVDVLKLSGPTVPRHSIVAVPSAESSRARESGEGGG
jgi:hypothetical protein